MKRKVAILVLAVAVLLSLQDTAFASSTVSVTIDGKEIQFSEEYGYPFIDENNRTQVPLRIVMEAYGCDVTWDSTNKSAVVEKDGKTVTIPIGKDYILVNNQITSIDTVSLIRDNRTYLPIRAVLEAFGANVEWDATNNTVVVSSPATVMQFQNIYIDENGDLIVQLLDGSEKNLGTVKGEDGKDGINGSNGHNGTSVVNVYINTAGELVIELSNGRVINAGTISQSGRAVSFDDYAVGTKFYMTKPAGQFDTTVYVDDNPYVVSFNSIYYELTSKNDYTDEDAWYYQSRPDGIYTFFLPYQVSVHFDGTTDSSLAGKQLYVVITNTQGRYGFFVTVQNNGTFSSDFAIGNGIDSINVWYAPQPLYFCQIVCYD
ncbi:MAG: stalk domain-containing protein [Oscillospiraceae bacterium]